ncbi:MAG: MFS transporter [Acidimicrobiales bacterium]
MDTGALDPRRWFTLAIVVTAVLIVAMDNTILNVALPSIRREFATELSSLQWVVTGYSLTFATLLIIGGRLGDVYGARRAFITGAAIFTVGSLLASFARSVPVLVIGEAVIEGVGASLMLPATLSVLSKTFVGRERATAFAAWGATAGAAVAIGPIVGGYLTTTFSWRWSFRINVVIAPLALIGALIAFRRDATPARRPRIDVPGALLVATGTFLLVFGLSEGAGYGWWRPTAPFTVGSAEIWPGDAPLSLVPVAFALAIALLAGFVIVERVKERDARDPLFELGQLRHSSFRYGLLTTAVLAMGQLAFLFVLPIYLQEGKHLSAQSTGLWLVPSGLFIIVGAQVGGHLTRRHGPTGVVRVGLLLEAVGLVLMAMSVSPGLTMLRLVPSLAVFGLGVGFASSQLTNVILSEIEPEKSGAASGANTTVRQIGAALGVAGAGIVLATASAPAAGARAALLVAALEVGVGAGLSLLIPASRPVAPHAGADLAGALDPLVPDGASVLEQV